MTTSVTVRRTSRALLDRSPSAVAIIGDDAVTSPRHTRLNAKLRLSPSAEAASGRAPSRPISSTAVAWISVKMPRATPAANDTAQTSTAQRAETARPSVVTLAAATTRTVRGRTGIGSSSRA